MINCPLDLHSFPAPLPAVSVLLPDLFPFPAIQHLGQMMGNNGNLAAGGGMPMPSNVGQMIPQQHQQLQQNQQQQQNPFRKEAQLQSEAQLDQMAACYRCCVTYRSEQYIVLHCVLSVSQHCQFRLVFVRENLTLYSMGQHNHPQTSPLWIVPSPAGNNRQTMERQRQQQQQQQPTPPQGTIAEADAVFVGTVVRNSGDCEVRQLNQRKPEEEAWRFMCKITDREELVQKGFPKKILPKRPRTKAENIIHCPHAPAGCKASFCWYKDRCELYTRGQHSNHGIFGIIAPPPPPPPPYEGGMASARVDKRGGEQQQQQQPGTSSAASAQLQQSQLPQFGGVGVQEGSGVHDSSSKRGEEQSSTMRKRPAGDASWVLEQSNPKRPAAENGFIANIAGNSNDGGGGNVDESAVPYRTSRSQSSSASVPNLRLYEPLTPEGGGDGGVDTATAATTAEGTPAVEQAGNEIVIDSDEDESGTTDGSVDQRNNTDGSTTTSPTEQLQLHGMTQQAEQLQLHGMAQQAEQLQLHGMTQQAEQLQLHGMAQQAEQLQLLGHQSTLETSAGGSGSMANGVQGNAGNNSGGLPNDGQQNGEGAGGGNEPGQQEMDQQQQQQQHDVHVPNQQEGTPDPGQQQQHQQPPLCPYRLTELNTQMQSIGQRFGLEFSVQTGDIVQLSRTQPNMSDILIFEDLGPGVQVNEMRVRRQLCRDGRLLNWSVRQPTQLWAKADPAQFLLAVRGKCDMMVNSEPQFEP